MLGGNDVGHIDLFNLSVSEQFAAREAFAGNLACLGDVHKRLRIAGGDDIFDAVYLFFGSDADDDVVFLAGVVTDGFGDGDASMELNGQLVRDCIRFVRDDCENQRRHQAR